ncbi:ATP-binding protein, partial [Pseudomonas aeruginosa]
MDAVTNPYAPGAGTRPPELAGRDDIRSRVAVCIARLQKGRHDKSILMVGLRGVGKTVLLDQMRHDAEAAGAHTLRIEAPEDRSLPAILAPQLRV